MVKACAAFNCSNLQTKDCTLSFHKFPLKKKNLLKEWLHAVRRKDFVPSQYHRLCSNHFVPEDFWRGGTHRTLKETAVPSRFDFPDHVQSKIKKRPQVERCKRQESVEISVIPQEDHDAGFTQELCRDVLTEHNYTFSPSPSKVIKKLETTLAQKESEICMLRAKISSSEARCRRRDIKIQSMSALIKKLQDNNLP